MNFVNFDVLSSCVLGGAQTVECVKAGGDMHRHFYNIVGGILIIMNHSIQSANTFRIVDDAHLLEYCGSDSSSVQSNATRPGRTKKHRLSTCPFVS